MAEQVKMPASLRNHLEAKMIGQEIDGFTIRDVLGCGNTAVTYDVRDKYDIPWALKLVMRESYGGRAPFREISRFADTEDDRFLVFPKEIGDWILNLGRKSYEFVWFKSKPVRGVTLKSFLESGTNFSAHTEILRYVENLTVALEELGRLGFSHGDLHDRNIMRQVIGEKGTNPEVRYVIIDFSEAHPLEETQEGLLKDTECLGNHLRSFYDVICQRETITREDERVLAAIAHIPGLLNGAAAESTGISKPSDVLTRIKGALAATKEAPRQLKDPFEPLNTENITNDALLADLCLTKMPWTSKLEKIGNVLLIGPRGCGKTMIFRRLRLKTKIVAGKKREIKDDPYVCFYLPCESLFFMRFSDLSDVDINKNKQSLILYFNMAILAEVASTLSILPVTLGPVSKSVITKLGELLKEELGPSWEKLRFPPSIVDLDELISHAGSSMRYIRKSIAYGECIEARGSTDFVTQLVGTLKKEIPALSQRYFIFSLDDYTEGRVPMALQEALHPVVCQRSSDICFKISAHMFGSIYHFPRPLALDEGRNIEVINLGSAYLKLNKRRKEGKLLLRILNERFKHCEGYEGTIEEWLGKTMYPGGRTLSRALHDENTRSKVHYYGIECLMDLCTGDYSEMIRMVGEIFREAGKRPGAKSKKIAPSVQDRAIYRVSREYLSRILHIRPDGPNLFDIVESFGNLSKNLLYERKPVRQGTTSKGRTRREPYDLLTVYVDAITRASQAAQNVWQRLQQASIFVDVGLATSQRSVVADRATLRRIYCPALRTTLTSSEHLQLSKEQFEYFMDKPQEFCKDHFRRVLKQSDQAKLWDEDKALQKSIKEESPPQHIPTEKDRVDFTAKAPTNWTVAVNSLTPLTPVADAIQKNAEFDLFIGALGFEERTTKGAAALVERGVKVLNAVLLEFDRYYEANEKRRATYEILIGQLTSGKAHRPFNSPVDNPDHGFPMRMGALLGTVTQKKCPRILFDCTSCPSLILSKTLSALLRHPCELTILYSEAEQYFPTPEDWEVTEHKAYMMRVRGPFEGIRYVAKPPMLQADDTGEQPVLLVLFPTFNKERTDGVLADLNPAERIWFFGEPHDLEKNLYRIEMEKSYAAPLICPEDKWSLLTTFDYRKTLLALGGIYAEYRFDYRIVIMPHGSKAQTLGANLFAATHETSMVFAMPQEYNPDKYSKGCIQVWAIPLGETAGLVEKLRLARALGRR